MNGSEGLISQRNLSLGKAAVYGTPGGTAIISCCAPSLSLSRLAVIEVLNCNGIEWHRALSAAGVKSGEEGRGWWWGWG